MNKSMKVRCHFLHLTLHDTKLQPIEINLLPEVYIVVEKNLRLYNLLETGINIARPQRIKVVASCGRHVQDCQHPLASTKQKKLKVMIPKLKVCITIIYVESTMLYNCYCPTLDVKIYSRLL
jgi:hypothetical protein